MEIIADFHIHSHYSRATSSDCCPEKLDLWARRKGVNLLGTGDFTHAGWRKELKEKLIATGDGFYELKKELRIKDIFDNLQMKFVITGEISSIYKKKGRTRKIHNLIIFPSLEDAEKLSLKLEKIGNLHSDGRPIIGLDSKNLLEMVLEVSPKALFVPAHIWTPHFSLFGANSGFDDIEECFEDLTEYIYSLETGLSSDPAMNWRVSKLDRFALTSNSDAHSPANIAREANVFHTNFTYDSIYNAIKNNDKREFVETIEFFPEEGKYHYDGHRVCKIQWEPSKTLAAGGICPICGGKLTVGVLHRVEILADRKEGYRPHNARDFIRLTTLQHIIAAVLGCSQGSSRVIEYYDTMIKKLGPELLILRKLPFEEIKNCAGDIVAEGIKRVREGKLQISAGYDGQYGIIEIFTEAERKEICGQLSLLDNFLISKKNKKEEKNTIPKLQKKEKIEKKQDERDSKGNEEQKKAITSNSDCILVVAGPGTGKTFTLVNRIVYLINEKKKETSNIIAVTFTNKAADEMRSRLSNLLPQEIVDRITIGTFHSMCFNLICKYNKKIFNIADETVALAIIGDLLKKNSLDYKATDILNEIAKAKTSNEIQLSEETRFIFEQYQDKLISFNALDFEDIMLKAIEVCKNNPEFSNKDILVDEFQDINSVQYELLKLWKGNKGSLFVIGDPHQAIYGFRGSSYQFFNKLKEEFKNIDEIVLKYNYRSTSEIIEAAKCIIRKSKKTIYMPTFESTFKEKGEKICFVNVTDEMSEGIFIAKKINELVGGIDMLDADISTKRKRENFYSFSDICILFRTHRQAEIIEECLSKEGIPYSVAGKEQVLSSEIVLKIITLIRFIINPSDALSLLLSLKYMGLSTDIATVYGNGERTIGKLVEILKEKENRKEVEDFVKTLNFFTNAIEENKEVDLVIKEIVKMWNIREDEPSIEKFLKIVKQYPNITTFAQTLCFARDADIIRSENKKHIKETVHLSTLHAAKGLEFKVVFICGVNDGIIPLLSKRGLKNDIEEERRLFYVGITRAARELFLVYTQKNSLYGNNLSPSRFLDDIDKKYIITEKYNNKPEAIQLSLF